VSLVLVFSQSSFIQSLKKSAYDWGVGLTPSKVNIKVVAIAIDDVSIAKYS
jgi:CHASE2 domain-containing sensor protein